VLGALLLLLLLPGTGLEEHSVLALFSELLLLLVLLAGIGTLAGHHALRLACWTLVGASTAIRWLLEAGWGSDLLPLNLLLTFISLLPIAWIVLLQLSGGGRVSAHHVRGAIALYLLVAAIFAYADAYLEVVRPNSFRLPDWWAREQSHRPEAFFYFSVVTLTTLGYGDIIAVRSVARELVMLEALIGQLYPAIIIARLVTLELQNRPSGAGAARPPTGTTYGRDGERPPELPTNNRGAGQPTIGCRSSNYRTRIGSAQPGLSGGESRWSHGARRCGGGRPGDIGSYLRPRSSVRWRARRGYAWPRGASRPLPPGRPVGCRSRSRPASGMRSGARARC
jgi:hypothetical protein